MNILAISQVYWPDTASVGQHLQDLSEALVEKGHNLSVLTSANNYEKGNRKYPKSEIHKGVFIKRVNNTSFSKKHKIGRILNFFTFNLLIISYLIKINRKEYDIILGLTSPPLSAFIGVIFSKIKDIRFCFWAMDLQPELAIQAGYIKEKSIQAKIFSKMGQYVYKNSDMIISLDKFMSNHISNFVVNKNKIITIPVWPVMNYIYSGKRLENPFRIANGFHDKIVIMYSGTMSVVHPLNTLLEVARKLQRNNKYLFVFIGEGVRKKEIINYQEKYNLENIIILPYQDRNKIHLSLGSADLQVVIMGDGQVGYTHPNKIYGAMFIGKPILYIGPEQSHISEILDKCPMNISVRHGDIDKLFDEIIKYGKLNENERQAIGQNNMEYAKKYYKPEVLINKMINTLENKEDNEQEVNKTDINTKVEYTYIEKDI